MNNYILLADYIDKLYKNPYCQPHDESRAFVKIFRKLLTEEEAALAMKLDREPVKAEEFAQKTNLPMEKAKQELDKLGLKGVAFITYREDVPHYNLAPFCPGILEFLVNFVSDEEISQHIQEYVEEINRFIRKNSPSSGAGSRVLTVNEPITARPYRASFSQVLLHIEKARVFSVADCICRSAKKTLGQGCGYPIEGMCIQVGPCADYYIRTGRGRRIAKEDAIHCLEGGKEEGLYHEVFRVEGDEHSYFICNCCKCCCLPLRTVLRERDFSAITRSRYVAKVREEKCIACGTCVKECLNNALNLCARPLNHAAGYTHKIKKEPFAGLGTGPGNTGMAATVDLDKCIGCGICTFQCRYQAIDMIKSSDI